MGGSGVAVGLHPGGCLDLTLEYIPTLHYICCLIKSVYVEFQAIHWNNEAAPIRYCRVWSCEIETFNFYRFLIGAESEGSIFVQGNIV